MCNTSNQSTLECTFYFLHTFPLTRSSLPPLPLSLHFFHRSCLPTGDTVNKCPTLVNGSFYCAQLHSSLFLTHTHSDRLICNNNIDETTHSEYCRLFCLFVSIFHDTCTTVKGDTLRCRFLREGTREYFLDEIFVLYVTVFIFLSSARFHDVLYLFIG